MRVVGIKDLKNRLSEYIRLAAAGEPVLVTDRDRVVAELRAPESTRAEHASDALLANLVREGFVRAPLTADPTPPPSRPVMSLADVMKGLSDDRAER